MVMNGRPVKRAKRRVTADLCDFLTFPADEAAAELDGPFRTNVRAFLALFGRSPVPAVGVDGENRSVVAWRVAFGVGGCTAGEDALVAARVELDILEEEVIKSKSVYCDQCRVVGWSDHPVCGKRYHFILRNDSSSLPSYNQACIHCGTLLSISDIRCISCNQEVTNHDFEDWALVQLENSAHLLHGVVHANGYGHLLRVNGKEGGSKYLTGRDIMRFWDRLCKMLKVRKVSVMDISKKCGMEYRLLHAVTDGHPWYGDWDYRFGAGSFALTEVSYKKAVDTLEGIPLSIFFSYARSPRTPLQNTIAFYQSLSSRLLITVQDLFCFVKKLLRDVRSKKAVRSQVHAAQKLPDIFPVITCTWPVDVVQKAEEVIIKILRAVGDPRWVSWRALRGATCHAVKPLELLDFCLNTLGGKVSADGKCVALRCNTETKAIEYRLEAVTDNPVVTKPLPSPSADQLLTDLKFLYDALLNPATMECYKPTVIRESAQSSAMKLMDCKQFIKHYNEPASKLMPSNPFVVGIWCHVEVLDNPKNYTSPPPEILVLPMTATVADLKLQAAKAFQETYLIFKKFQVEELMDFKSYEDNTLVTDIFASNSDVRIRGRFIDNDEALGMFSKERGLESWIVDCSCGARDDDGERMMACDICEVWQHTRCAGVNDCDDVPVKFICTKCVPMKSKGAGSRRNRNFNQRMRCKDDVKPALNSVNRVARLTPVS